MSDTLYLTEARRLEGNRQIQLAWTDGHRAVFEADYLRGWCPCAMCQGHGPSELVYHPPKRPVTMVRIEPVGNYAIRIEFDDLHDSGLFSWQYLYELGRGREVIWQQYLDALEREGLSRDP